MSSFAGPLLERSCSLASLMETDLKLKCQIDVLYPHDSFSSLAYGVALCGSLCVANFVTTRRVFTVGRRRVAALSALWTLKLSIIEAQDD